MTLTKISQKKTELVARPAEYQEPEAIIAMLNNDLVAIDCKTPGYPCFKNPYAMDFNESPVTSCRYLVDCPGDFIPALYMVGAKVHWLFLTLLVNHVLQHFFPRLFRSIKRSFFSNLLKEMFFIF